MNNNKIERNWEYVQFTQGNKEPDLFQKDKARYIAQFLRDQFQLKNVSFLFGSGTSSPALPLMKDLYKGIKEQLESNKEYEEAKKLFEKVSTNAQQNLEEILGLLYAHFSYCSGIGEEGEPEYKRTKDLINRIESYILAELNQNILEKSLKEEKEERKEFTSTLKVYEQFYRTLTIRSKELSRLCIFTTNNDLFNETAMDNTNTMYINGFTPGLRRYFNPSLFLYNYSKRMDTSIDKYEPVDNMVYLFKLHGSVNWIEEETIGNKFYNIVEIDSQQSIDRDIEDRVLIYPAPTKQNKSLGSPYTDIIRAFHHKLLEPNSVLFVCGYSFSDEHLNRIIYQALAANSSLNLVVVNNLDDNKEIKLVDDKRIYHLWEIPQGSTTEFNNSESGKEDNLDQNLDDLESDKETSSDQNPDDSKKQDPIHYFSEFVKLISEIFPYQDEEQLSLNKFSRDITQYKSPY